MRPSLWPPRLPRGPSWRLRARAWAWRPARRSGGGGLGAAAGEAGGHPLSTGPVDVPPPLLPSLWANQGVSGRTVDGVRGTRTHAQRVCVCVCVRARVSGRRLLWLRPQPLAWAAGRGEGLLTEHLCASPDLHAHLRATQSPSQRACAWPVASSSLSSIVSYPATDN